MMPVIALKTAIRDRLIQDSVLNGLLGGPHIYDEIPRAEITPYIVFAETEAKENGTTLDRGHLTDMTLNIWSRQGGSKEGWAIANRACQQLDDVSLPLSGQRLISLRVTSADQRRAPEKELTRIRLKLRAITEVI